MIIFVKVQFLSSRLLCFILFFIFLITFLVLKEDINRLCYSWSQMLLESPVCERMGNLRTLKWSGIPGWLDAVDQMNNTTVALIYYSVLCCAKAIFQG